MKLHRALALALTMTAGGAALAQQVAPPSLPPPSADPMKIDIAADPILRLARSQASPAMFRSTIASAVERHPATQEAEAQTSEARSVVDEAYERRLPSIDLSVSSYKVIAREFSNDPNNIIERSRPSQRTDATLTVQQTIFDFGAGAKRVEAAGARLRAAAADAEASADNIALNSIAAWYDVFAYRALVALTENFVSNQQELRAAVEERIRQGVSAPGDTARVESYLASAQTRLAGFRRQLSNAEARFTQLTGSPPPPNLERAPVADLPAMSRDAAALQAMSAPQPRAAQALADSARREAQATKSDRLPQVGVGVDAGRYGVFENATDYDIRGRVTLRQRLFGGTEARLAQAQARARSADARATRIREESARDASIAWSDVQALEEQLKAQESNYIASRRSRDVLVERFINARGTLFDVVAAEDSYFETATAYIRALSELDAARYVLLSRTGGLLAELQIDPASVGGQK
ncbi:MAG: TolC family protein [Alphaproteobacteria bacterium]|nr:TolC family protein [Alphaproteobacteria bacterium]MBV9373438.1 TolC family protein [Alphaproteobacteria bacterium]MBV9900980.1 TolC family protein [Alphaproteobacteria bacterium]